MECPLPRADSDYGRGKDSPPQLPHPLRQYHGAAMPLLPSSPRAELVRAAVHAAAAVVGQAVTALVVTVAAAGVEVEVRVSAEEVLAVLGPVERPALTGLESELLAVLTDKESKPAAIAHRAGKNLNSHVYDALRSLAIKGYAGRGERGGYLLVHSRFHGIE